jgi:hypothetical protein
VIYDTANADPKQYVVWLRFLTSFEFGYFRIAHQVQAVATGSAQAVPFHRYSVFTNQFKPETLQPINMKRHGAYMIYRNATFMDDACPGIAGWKMKAEQSAKEREFASSHSPFLIS